MHIALVCPFNPYPARTPTGLAHTGGVERVFAEVSAALARRGHQVTMVTSTAGPSDEQQRDGVRLLRGRRLATLLRAPMARLASRIPRDAEIVHVAATYPFCTGASLRHAHRLGIPTVLDFHFDPVPSSPLGRAGASVYRRIGPPFYPLARVVLVRSLSYARSAPSLASVPESRLRFVPNGIDLQRFTLRGPRREGDYLLFVGRLVPYKGVEVLLQALAKAQLTIPLVLVGDGPLRANLEAEARRLGVDARFLGHIEDEELAPLYRGARLTVLPSVNGQEAFGIVLIESMACGTPVVASDLPGVSDVARLGGWVATPGDVEDLAARLAEAWTAAPSFDNEGMAQRVRAQYSWDAVAARLEDIYVEAIQPRRSQAEVQVAHPGSAPLL